LSRRAKDLRFAGALDCPGCGSCQKCPGRHSKGTVETAPVLRRCLQLAKVGRATSPCAARQWLRAIIASHAPGRHPPSVLHRQRRRDNHKENKASNLTVPCPLASHQDLQNARKRLVL